MTKIEQLKTLYQEAAPGEWLATAGVVYAEMHDEESRVADCDFGCREDFATAQFIAHVHEAFPMLLEAVELLETAAARVSLANDEGNPILSAWLTDANLLLNKLEGHRGELK